jgi:hypothetical protein
MGLTVSCARCHDHKYDPIPTRDYYSLYGVFASCHEPGEKPLLGNAALPKEYPDYLAERDKREEELKTFRETKEAEVRAKLRSQAGDYLLAAHEASKLDDQSKKESLVRERKLDPGVARRWQESLDNWGKGHHPIFAPWLAFAALPEKDFEAKAKELKFTASTEGTNAVNPLVARALAEPPSSLKQVAERYNKLFADIDKEWKSLLEAHAKTNNTVGGPNLASAPPAFSDSDQEALRQVLYAPDAPPNVDFDSLRRLLDTPAQQKLRALRRKVEELDATHSGSPPRAMALVDNASPNNPRVFIRGNPNNPGPEVPRQFLELIAGEKRQPFEKGSGRLELPSHRHYEQSADRAGDCESRMDVPLRRGPGTNAQRLWRPLGAAHPSGIARLAGNAVHVRRMVAQESSSLDHAVQRLPAGQRERSSSGQNRPKQPTALEDESPPSGF